MTQTSLMPESRYDWLKRRGVDMSWYDRVKAKQGVRRQHGATLVPLTTEICAGISIYLLKKDGSLWTIESDGSAREQVRAASKAIARDTFICMCCKGLFRTVEGAHQHYAGGTK